MNRFLLEPLSLLGTHRRDHAGGAGKTEYREIAQRWLGFDASERQALRQAVRARDSLLARQK